MTGAACDALRPAVEALAEGELEPGPLLEQAREHLDGCAACQAAVEATQELRDAVADAVPMPPADVWRVFDGELRERLRAETPERAGILLRFPRVVSALVAAAALLLAAGLFAFELREPQTVLGLSSRLPVYSLDYGDPLWQPGPERGPVDPSTVEGLPLVADQLSPAALDALTRQGLVQVPSGTERVADLYPLAPRPGDLPLLATADASLLLAGAATSRAALALEAEVIAPGLRELLAHALLELRALEVGARDDDARRATRRARELLGVAALLAGTDPRLPPDSLARARAEVDRVLAAAGPYASAVLGREVDARAFAPRGLFALAPDLHGHARAAAWLSLAGLTLDATRPDDVRAAGALALALARGRGERRTGLDLQARLEAAVEVLYGTPDGLTPLDMVEVLRQGLGAEALTVSDLCAPGAVERLAERARVEAAARGRERVGPPGPPVLRLLGGTRSLEGVVLTRLAPPVLARPAPSSLDLLVVLGSRRARTAVSALQLDAPGYDPAVKALGPVCGAWADAARRVPVRTCLEQARLWAAGALVVDDPVAAPVSAAAYRDRLLLAGLAALNAPPASADVGHHVAEGLAGPVPLVEPLPRLHARLAFTAERLARVLDDLTATTRPRPRTVRAILALRRVARLEAALRDASLAALDGQPPAPAALEALRDYAPALHALGPASALSVEDVFVQTAPDGGVRVLHRAVHALDRLLLIVVDPSTGRPVLSAGAALSASEPWSQEGARLGPDAVRTDPRDPRWAAHVVRR